VPTTVAATPSWWRPTRSSRPISGFAAGRGGGRRLLIMKVAGDIGPDLALRLAGVVRVSACGRVLAVSSRAARTAALPPDEREEVELESEGIRHAARSVAFARGVVGFLTFMLAFYFKDLEGKRRARRHRRQRRRGPGRFMVGAWGAPGPAR